MLVFGLRVARRVRVTDNMKMSSSTRQFEEAGHSEIYAKYRPVAPPSIVEHILAFRGQQDSRAETLALDVGCGSGQFTRLLPSYFSRVLATDVSQSQVEEARRELADLKVKVELGSGEELALADSSLDLLTICQALHWLDLERFYSEVERVLRPGGVLAVLGYHMTRPAPQYSQADKLNAAFMSLYEATAPYWSKRRHHVDSGYLTLPAAKLRRQERDDTRHYVDNMGEFSHWVGYIRTWSGLQNMAREEGQEAVERLINKFLLECREVLGLAQTEDIMSVKVLLRTQYWLILYQK